MVNKCKGKRKGKNKGKGKGDKGGKDSKTVVCYTCGQKGHISPNCPMRKGKAKGSQSKCKGQWYGKYSERQEIRVDIESYADSDWAGYNATKKSTRGTITTCWGSPLLHISRTQATI
eukprot:4279192-Amphidinium_carterae.1